MTPEEVFARLRDVHVPEVQSATGSGLDPRPLVVFGILVSVMFAFRFWMRWREKKSQLEQIDTSLPPAVQRDQIARVLRRAPRRNGAPAPPAAFFAPPSRLTARDVADLRQWARRRLG